MRKYFQLFYTEGHTETNYNLSFFKDHWNGQGNTKLSSDKVLKSTTSPMIYKNFKLVI